MTLWLSLVFAAILAAPGFAEKEIPIVLLQPIMTKDSGVVASPMTLLHRGDLWSKPGWSVVYTLADALLKADMDLENRNAAMVGLRLKLLPHDAASGVPTYDGLFGDTLRAVLDVDDAIDQFGNEFKLWNNPLEEVVLITIYCFRVNLRQEYPRIRYLDLRVKGYAWSEELTARGPGKFERLGGTYEIRAEVESD